MAASSPNKRHHQNESPGTPTPSEKVSRWHRDIFLVSPPVSTGKNSGTGKHPRQCICDQCMAEYGTYRIYNQLLHDGKNTDENVIIHEEEIEEIPRKERNEQVRKRLPVK
jgi:hypothetical protein